MPTLKLLKITQGKNIFNSTRVRTCVCVWTSVSVFQREKKIKHNYISSVSPIILYCRSWKFLIKNRQTFALGINFVFVRWRKRLFPIAIIQMSISQNIWMLFFFNGALECILFFHYFVSLGFLMKNLTYFTILSYLMPANRQFNCKFIYFLWKT